MCGIVGYIGFNQASDFLLDGMAKLEYRGYDSAGIAVIGPENVIKIQKKVGRLANLEAIVKADPNEGTVGIGHTRWATHGRPSDMNAHPHSSEDGKFAVVHNGIIENYQQLKEMLQHKGKAFSSETDTEVVALSPSRRGGWSVQLADGSGLFAPHVVAAMGGSAAPSMGTDGTGARLMQALSHEITPLYPALVQLRCSHPALKGLKGIRTQAELTLMIDGRAVLRETGELLLTDYGVSGVCVFQLSREAAPALAQGRSVRLAVNFLPEIPSLLPWLDARIRQLAPVSLLALTTGVLPRLLAQTVIREARLSPDMPAEALSESEKQALCGALSAFPLVVTGTQGFANAQVTRGGVSLADVDPSTMASRLFDGLHIIGELLDVDGPCGGYNLHFAFAGALAAAKAIAG